MILKKLNLDRDFTRFFNDPTFPYKVTVCIGKERFLCSGVLLAQQSPVLEKKFREDDGVLMFEEMLDLENSDTVLVDCIQFLHGKDLLFAPEHISAVMKFASFYKVQDLFKKGLEWIKFTLNESKSIKDMVEFLRLSNSLDAHDSISLKSVIKLFIGLNKDIVGSQIGNFLELGVTGFDLAHILEQRPASCGCILKRWCSLKTENRNFVVNNSSLFNFGNIFPDVDEFNTFLSSLSIESQSVNAMKALLDIQKLYFTAHDKLKDGDKKGKPATTAALHNQSCSSKPASSSVFSTKPTYGIARTNVPNRAESVMSSYRASNQKVSPGWSGSLGHRPSPWLSTRLDLVNTLSGGNSSYSPDRSLQISVSNIPKRVSKNELRSFFGSDYGKIDSVDYERGDGFAILTFQDSQSVSDLLDQAPSFTMYGQCLSYEEYFESESENDSTFVYIGNLPPSASKKKLMQLFKFAGVILDVEIFKDSSSATIEFNDVDSANRLLDCGRRFMFDGFELEVDEVASSSSDEENSTVYVGNLPIDASKNNIRRIMAGFGKINNITMKKRKDKTYGFVEYETVGSALAAVRANDTKKFEINGTVLKVAMKRND